MGFPLQAGRGAGHPEGGGTQHPTWKDQRARPTSSLFLEQTGVEAVGGVSGNWGGQRAFKERALRNERRTTTVPRYPPSPNSPPGSHSHSGSECRLSPSDDAFWAYFLHSSHSLFFFPWTTVNTPPQRSMLALQFGAFNFLQKPRASASRLSFYRFYVLPTLNWLTGFQLIAVFIKAACNTPIPCRL